MATDEPALEVVAVPRGTMLFTQGDKGDGWKPHHLVVGHELHAKRLGTNPSSKPATRLAAVCSTLKPCHSPEIVPCSATRVQAAAEIAAPWA